MVATLTKKAGTKYILCTVLIGFFFKCLFLPRKTQNRKEATVVPNYMAATLYSNTKTETTRL